MLLNSSMYLIRLDDACSSSDFSKWRAVEDVLDSLNIKPIVATIPDNQDPTLNYSNNDSSQLWNLVRNWQDKGWSIAMHGYQHKFHHVDRNKLLFPFYDRSEFGGLDLDSQIAKLDASFKIFKHNKVEPSLWVAPAHSFDITTIKALKKVVPFRIISDGISMSPFTRDDFCFIPQQLWKPVFKKYGVWTICLHPDTMSYEDIESLNFELNNKFYCDRFVRVEDVCGFIDENKFINSLYSNYFWTKHYIKTSIKKYLNNFF